MGLLPKGFIVESPSAAGRNRCPHEDNRLGYARHLPTFY